MNFRKISLILFYVLLLMSCEQNEQSINGHWHSVTSDFAYFNTLDISDSMTITDKYNLHGYSRHELPRLYNSEKILPVDDFDYTNSFFISDDTLFIQSDSSIIKYVKSNIKECIFEDRYVNRYISIDLEVDDDALAYQEALNLMCVTNVYAGKLNQESYYSLDSLSNTHPDSVFVQVNDILIKLSTLPKHLDIQTDMCSPRTTIVSLHLDKSVSNKFIGEMLWHIPDSLNVEIKRVVKMFNGDIGLKGLER